MSRSAARARIKQLVFAATGVKAGVSLNATQVWIVLARPIGSAAEEELVERFLDEGLAEVGEDGRALVSWETNR